MNRKLFVCIGFLFLGITNVFSQTDNGALTSAINKITANREKRTELTNFVKGILEHGGASFYEELPNEYHGIDYIYDVNGKYLFVYKTSYGGSGSSYEHTTSYVIDTESKRIIPARNIFVNLSAPAFNKLIIQYLSGQDDFDMIDQEYLPDSVAEFEFSLFYSKNGVGMQWDRGSISANAFGPYKIVLPYSSVQNYLTPAGKEIFK